jgi:hypothetical protein
VRDDLIEERFFVGPFKYEVVIRAVYPDIYAVRVLNEHGENEWLKHPELRYETLGGARYAILQDIEWRVSKYVRVG